VVDVNGSGGTAGRRKDVWCGRLSRMTFSVCSVHCRLNTAEPDMSTAAPYGIDYEPNLLARVGLS